jgi:2',3'-cyclic-nucleotide 2'-phosphodiesterase (5'-nucleotidase family)
LLDVGNFLFGSDSMASKGQVIVAAYQVLGYDAVNLSYRDFRLGKAHTLELLGAGRGAGAGKPPAVSANLLDDVTGKPLVAPYVVRKLGGQRIALIGITELPPGLDLLPHVKQQLAGIRIRPPTEALDEWIPKAQAESDQVVLMYYGPSAGLQRILSSNHAAALTLIAVGNIRPEQLPTSTTTPIVASDEHGKDLGRASPAAAGAGSPTIEQVILDDSVAADPAMTTLLAR